MGSTSNANCILHATIESTVSAIGSDATNNGVTFVPGRVGNCGDFGTNTDWFSYPQRNVPTKGAWQAWLKPVGFSIANGVLSVAAYRGVFSYMNAALTNYFDILMSNAGIFIRCVEGGVAKGYGTVRTPSGFTVADGEWFFMRRVWNKDGIAGLPGGTTEALYFARETHEVPVLVDSTTNALMAAALPINQTLCLGNARNTLTDSWRGLIGGVREFNADIVDFTGWKMKGFPLLTKTYDFGTPGDYALSDAAKLEIVSGVLRQKAIALTAMTFFATYNERVDADYGGGSRTGTPSGTVSVDAVNKFAGAGSLNLRGAAAKGVNYNPVGNANFSQVGTVSFRFRPNWSGMPSDNRMFFDIRNSGAALEGGRCYLRCAPSGGVCTIQLVLNLNDGSGRGIGNWFTWLPVAGTWYHWELDIDLIAGATRCFIDGVQNGATLVGTGARNGTIMDQFAVGRFANGTASTADGNFDGFCVYNTVQHTANFTPESPSVYMRLAAILSARYDYSTSLDYESSGAIAPSATAGSPAISTAVKKFGAGSLDLTGAGNRWVKYLATGLANVQRSGTISVEICPNYTGDPLATQNFCNISNNADDNNKILLQHLPGGNLLSLSIYGPTGVLEVSITAVWSPTAGTWYHFEADFSSGASTLFVDGAVVGTSALALTRASAQYLMVGDTPAAAGTANFYLDDIVVYDSVLHTGAFTPPIVAYDTTLPSAKVVTPIYTHSPGTYSLSIWKTLLAAIDISQWRTIQEIGGVNYWWTGSTWATSDGSWAQANSFSDALANFGTLPTRGLAWKIGVMLAPALSATVATSSPGAAVDTEELAKVEIGYERVRYATTGGY